FYDINKRFGGLDIALVGIESDDVFAPQFVQRLQQVTRELKETPGLDQALSVANVMDFAPDKEKGGIIAGPMIMNAPRTGEERAALRAKVMSRDLVVGNLVSENGKAVLIYCFLSFGTEVKAISKEIERVVTAAFPNERKYWGGNPFISSYIYNTTQEDLWRLTPWAGLAIILIMMLAFRDVVATCLALLSTAIGIVMSLGLMGLAGVRFNIVLGSMPIIMLALGSAYAIHVLARYYILRQQADTEEAVRRTIAGVGPTVVAAGLTTVASLLSFCFMDLEPLRVFGLFTAIGLTIKLILSVTFIPAVVRLLNPRRKPAGASALRAFTRALATFARRHRLAVGLPLLAVAAAGLCFSFRVDARLDQSAFFSTGSPPDRAEKYMRQHFGGSQFMQLQVKGDMTDPGVLREVQRMADEIALFPHVSSVTHVAQVIAQVQNAMTGERRVADTPGQVKQLYSFTAGDPSARQLVTDDRTEALLQIKMDSIHAADLEGPLARIEAWAAQQDVRSYLAPGAPGYRPEAGGERRRAIVLARIRAAALAAGIPLGDDAVARLRAQLGAPAPAVDPKPVAEALRTFLRSEESVVELPPAAGADDPAQKVAAALAAAGPDARPAAVTAAIAGALGKPATDSTVEDLATGVRTPVRELWAKERAGARGRQLLQVAGITPPAGRRGELFAPAVTAALLDLDTPAVLLPAGTAAPSGSLGLQVTGMPVMNRGLSRSVTANQLRSFSVALCLVFVIMTFLFRSLWSGFLGMAPASITMLCIYGGMGLFGVRLDIGTSMLGSMIIGAGVDYAIHMLAAWRAPAGGSLEDAAARGADRSGLAVWCNALMVAAGFFVLTLGQARPLKLVGGLVSAAMLIAAFATYFAIPVLARRASYRRSAEPVAAEAAASEVADARHSAADHQ
ncbi:MAG: MMPL family transporter, partial [Deltaproteobacteria bacterium]|nr:MMPL family transporter [Deltaproteobacteria bacterium]